jgi:carboxymethylenebutenolidase
MSPADVYVPVLHRHLEAENAHRMEDTLATLTPDCVFEDVALGQRFTRHDGAATYYRMWWTAFDTEVVPERLHLADGIAVAETTWRGIHVGTFADITPSGRRIDVAVAIVVELRDGLIAGERLYWDRARLLEQLGAQVVKP